MISKDEEWLLEEKYAGEKSAGFFTDCERLKTGEPLAYVIGWTPFLDCKIYLDSHPLIPRSETEFWAEYAIAEISKYFSPTKTDSFTPDLPQPNPPKSSRSLASFGGREALHVLDLCAGSGCIGVAVAKASTEARVDFSEIDPRLLPGIEKNIRENVPEPQHCRVFKSDLFAGIPTESQYDMILSNPPYIDPALDRTEPSVKNFEPHQALYGGTDGTEIIANIIQQAPNYLKPEGQLWLEHEPEQTTAIQTLANQHGWLATTHTDQYSVERYSILVLQ